MRTVTKNLPSTNFNNSAAPTSPQLQVYESINELLHRIDKIGNSIASLQQRLEPVLLPVDEVGVSNSKDECVAQPVRAEISRQISVQADVVRQLDDRINNILSRLQI